MLGLKSQGCLRRTKRSSPVTTSTLSEGLLEIPLLPTEIRVNAYGVPGFFDKLPTGPNCTDQLPSWVKVVMSSDISFVQQMFASCSGALLTSLFVTPLDVVKIRLQSQTERSSRKCFLYCNGLMDHLCVCLNGNNGTNKWYKKPGEFTGIVDAMMKISKYEGITSLWSGLSPTLVMAVPATVMYFTTYDRLKVKMQKSVGDYWLIPSLAGGIARVGTATVISPLELVRTKMQSRPLTYQEVAAVVRQSVQQSGARSLWMGLMPTILRDVPFSMIYWLGYETLKNQISMENLFLKSFVCGFSAGTVATICTNPFDVVKTRRQIALGEQAFLNPNSAPVATASIIRDIVRQNGLKGLFAGFLPRLAKIGPACAIMISSYEFGKRFFKNYNELHAYENEEFQDDQLKILQKSVKT